MSNAIIFFKDCYYKIIKINLFVDFSNLAIYFRIIIYEKNIRVPEKEWTNIFLLRYLIGKK